MAKSVTFISRKYKELRVVLDPKWAKEVEQRRVMTGLHGHFPAGKTVEFHDGVYVTSNEKEIELLKNHQSYGMSFYSSEDGADTPTDEALRHMNEKKTVAEEIASQCPECGKKFGSEAAVRAHMKVHK